MRAKSCPFNSLPWMIVALSPLLMIASIGCGSSMGGNAAAKTLKSISASPSTASIQVGSTQAFSVTATYSDASTADVSATASWATANPAVATINSSGVATAVAPGTVSVTATVGSLVGSAGLTVTAISAVKTIQSISVTPSPANFPMGTTQQFTATGSYSDGSTGDVTSTATWKIANTAVATVAPSGLASGEASGSTSITATLSGVSGSASMAVAITPGSGVNIPTWHFDTNRSGLNPGELSLSPGNVGSTTFGKLFSYLVDGYMYGEPLLISNLTIKGKSQNVLLAATEHDSVYAFDADTYGSGAPLWNVSLLQAGETPMTDGPIQPYQGVTSTPVIDPKTQTIYVVSAQAQAGGGSTFRLNALDITSGAQKFGGPITIHASVPATNSDSANGVQNLNTSCIQRAALLLANNSVYIGFGSCHSGWLLAYNATTLAQTGVFNSSPNLNGEGPYASAGGVWMGGGGPASDSAGNVYITTGNGPWDGKTAFGDSVLKFNATLQMQDYFTPNNFQNMDCEDSDLASGGLLLIPGTAQALAGGKTGKMYLVNTANLGHEQANDTGAIQTLWFEGDLAPPYSSSCTDSTGVNTSEISSYEIFGTSAYFNGSVYLGVTPTSSTAIAPIRQFHYSGGTLTPGPYSSPSIQENTRGTTPFLSSNGATSGILWMIDTGQPIQNSGKGAPTNAILRAYDADQFPNELYNSGMNATDQPGYGIKFSSPIVGNGKVYISTGHDPATTANPKGEIDVYGLH